MWVKVFRKCSHLYDFSTSTCNKTATMLGDLCIRNCIITRQQKNVSSGEFLTCCYCLNWVMMSSQRERRTKMTNKKKLRWAAKTCPTRWSTSFAWREHFVTRSSGSRMRNLKSTRSSCAAAALTSSKLLFFKCFFWFWRANLCRSDENRNNRLLMIS